MIAIAALDHPATPRPPRRSPTGRDPARPHAPDRPRKPSRTAVPAVTPYQQIRPGPPAGSARRPVRRFRSRPGRPLATNQIPIDRAPPPINARRPAGSFPGGLRTPALAPAPSPRPAGIHNPSQEETWRVARSGPDLWLLTEVDRTGWAGLKRSVTRRVYAWALATNVVDFSQYAITVPRGIGPRCTIASGGSHFALDPAYS